MALRYLIGVSLVYTIVSCEQFSASVNQFGLDLLKQMDHTASGMISPFSISTAMAILNAGANGTTKSEIDAAFGWTNIDVPEGFKELVEKLESKKDLQLTTANGLFLDKTFEVKDSYLEVVKTHFKAIVERLNFLVGDTTPAKDYINSWVEEKTQNKIKDLLSELSNDVRAVIVNAIYFKAQWENKFEIRDTADGDFYVDEDTTVTASFMSQVREYPYLSRDGLETIKIPYSSGDGRKISMLVFKPTEIGKLGSMEESVLKYDFSVVKSLISDLQITNMKLFLPKFTFETKMTDLVGYFKKFFGIEAVFGAADLSGISEAEKLRVSKIIHQSFVDVHENGTEAAAATAILIEKTSIGPDPIEVKLDRPFIFMIYDETNDIVLFLGRLIRPGKQAYDIEALGARSNDGNGAEASVFSMNLLLLVLIAACKLF